MSISKNIMSIAAFSIISLLSGLSFAESSIHLAYAESTLWCPPGGCSQKIYAEVVVEEPSEEQRVVVEAIGANGVRMQGEPLYGVTRGDGSEMYSVEFTTDYLLDHQLKAHLQLGEKRISDEADGKGYGLPVDSGPMLLQEKGVFHNGMADFRGTDGMHGFVLLKNMPEEARVFIVYSANQFRSSYWVEATQDGSMPGCAANCEAHTVGADESRLYSFSIDNVAQIGIAYHVLVSIGNDILEIDDNFGSNYHFPLD